MICLVGVVVIGVAAAASIDDVNTVLTETSLPGKPMSSPYAVALKDSSKLLYSNYGAVGASVDFVAQATRDGKDASVFALKGDLKVPIMHVRDIAVDDDSGAVFFVSYGGPTTAHIVRCTGVQACASIRQFVPSDSEEFLPSALAFSRKLKRIFYAVADGKLTKSAIYSAKPTGDDEQLFVQQSSATGVAFPVGLAIDDDKGHVYWSNDVGPDLVQRADLSEKQADVKSVGTLFSKRSSIRPFQIAVDSKGKQLYYVDQSTTPHSIGRVRLDVVDKHEELKAIADGSPHDIALDISGKKIYWSEIGSSTIKSGTVADLGVAPSAATQAALSSLLVLLVAFVNMMM